MRVLRATRLERSCGCTIGSIWSWSPAGPLTAQTVGFELAASQIRARASARPADGHFLLVGAGSGFKHVVLDVRL